MTDAVDRFLREIGDRVPPARIAVLYLFPPLRHGPVETGVAVMAMRPDDVELGSSVGPDDGTADDGTADEEPIDGDGDSAAEEARAVVLHGRHAIITAWYCSTLKGRERGKWEFSLAIEADAPLVTLESVVRGVQRRMGDDAEPLRLGADAVLATQPGVPWTTTN